MSIRTKVGLIIVIFVSVLGVNSVLISAWIAKNNDHGTLINAAGKLRMLSQKMTKETILVRNGVPQIKNSLVNTNKTFADILGMLIERTHADSIFNTMSNDIAKQFATVFEHWQTLNLALENPQPDNSPEALLALSNQSEKLLREADTAVSLLERHALASLHRLKNLALLVFATSVVTGFVIYNYLNRALLSRVYEINHTARRISQDRDLNTRLSPQGNDEISELAMAFNAMTSSLVQAQNELEAKALEAEKANQAKSDFLASMSHELRTPMNSIYGFCQLLHYDKELTDKHKENTAEILNASKHLLTLINDVLDLAKVEAQNIDLNLEVVDAYQLANECIKMMTVLATPKEIQLELTGKQPAYIKADRLCLKKSLLNLLANGIKYNKQQGRVSVDIDATSENTTIISVSDTGIGISEAGLQQLFQPFNRLASPESEIEGTGIGLALTKRLIEAMNGTVTAVSKEGIGSRFYISLPNEEGHANINQHQSNSQTTNTLKLLREQQRKCRLLYIEDNLSNLKLMQYIVAEYPLICMQATTDPHEGITLARNTLPHLIMVDISMPTLSGYDVLQSLRQTAALKEVPVIAISANAFPDQISRTKDAGFSDFIAKPIHLETFNEMLVKHLKLDHQYHPADQSSTTS